MRIQGSIIGLIGLAVLLGCTGSDEAALDGDATQASFGVVLTSSATTSSAPSTLFRMNEDGSFTPEGSGLTVASARLAAHEVKLKLPEGMTCAQLGFVPQVGLSCEEEIELEDGVEELESEIRIRGPIVFDLISGEATPDLSSLTIPSGRYRKIEVKMERAHAEDGLLANGDLLLDHSLIAEGEFQDRNQKRHQFRMRYEFSEEIEIESPENIEVSEGVVNEILATLDVEGWFANQNFADCVADGDLEIDPETDTLDLAEDSGQGNCSDIGQRIQENIRNSFQFRHRHHHGQDDSDELEDDDSGDDETTE